MAFEKIDSRPDPRAIIVPPKPGALIQKTAVPPASLFFAENIYWGERNLAAVANNDGGVEQRAALDLHQSFKSVVSTGRQLFDSIAAARALGQDPDFLRSTYSAWYRGGVSLLAYSGLCRAILPEMREGATGFVSPNPEDVSVCCDFSAKETDNIGVHATRGALTQELSIEWPEGATKDRPVWYEGETIYAAAFTPATVTTVLSDRFEEKYGQSFGSERAAQFASIVPYLKAEVLQ